MFSEGSEGSEPLSYVLVVKVPQETSAIWAARQDQIVSRNILSQLGAF